MYSLRHFFFLFCDFHSKRALSERLSLEERLPNSEKRKKKEQRSAKSDGWGKKNIIGNLTEHRENDDNNTLKMDANFSLALSLFPLFGFFSLADPDVLDLVYSYYSPFAGNFSAFLRDLFLTLCKNCVKGEKKRLKERVRHPPAEERSWVVKKINFTSESWISVSPEPICYVARWVCVCARWYAFNHKFIIWIYYWISELCSCHPATSHTGWWNDFVCNGDSEGIAKMFIFCSCGACKCLLAELN